MRSDLGLTCSIGVAPNNLLAKLASEVNKPDGLTVIRAEQVIDWLNPMPVERLWGVGPATTNRLHRYGFKTVGDVSRASPDHLTIALGSEAQRFYRLARGMDDRPVTPDHQAKSVGHEQTFEVDLENCDEVRAVLFEQAEDVARRLRRCNQKAGSITLKIRFGDFETITRSAPLPLRTDVTEEIWRAVSHLYDHWARTAYRPVRLSGMAATKLDDTAGQLPLFGMQDHDAKKVSWIKPPIASLNGLVRRAIQRGGSLGH